MAKSMKIKSYKGYYTLGLEGDLSACKEKIRSESVFVIIDKKVKDLHFKQFFDTQIEERTWTIHACEDNKNVSRVIPLIEEMVSKNIKRNYTLVAIGGGVIQDIACFIASILFRGMDWHFFPTTLLAQADSCIGSKSSINLGTIKNTLGTFHPPRLITLCPAFLETLSHTEICSGVGEIIKVHAIDGGQALDQLSLHYDNLFTSNTILQKYIWASLKIKKRFIEKDEFDQGIRNIFNYGHSFGHAIESATSYSVPHGIAITMGMHIANEFAVSQGLIKHEEADRFNTLLRKNFQTFCETEIDAAAMLDALRKDKKNNGNQINLILPHGPGLEIKKIGLTLSEQTVKNIKTALKSLKQ